MFEIRAPALRIRLSFWGIKTIADVTCNCTRISYTYKTLLYWPPCWFITIIGTFIWSYRSSIYRRELAGIHTFITTVKFSTQCTTSGPLLWMKTNATSKNWWVKMLFNSRITVEVSRENLSGYRIINIFVLWKN